MRTSGPVRFASRTARTIVVGSREVIAFAGCDYLGLAHHPQVISAAREGFKMWGVSVGASRETSGNHAEYQTFERELARFLGTETALLCTDGYLADLAVVQSVVDDHPVAVIDADAHSSLVDAARVAGCELYAYGAGDWRRCHELYTQKAGDGGVILTDGAFPAQGRLAPLTKLSGAHRSGGLLVVDESHCLGVLGPGGRGSAAAAGLSGDHILLTGSLAKALGCAGGFVAGSRARIARVRQGADAYACATPIPPALAAAARTALSLLGGEPDRLDRLRANTEKLQAIAKQHGFASDAPLPVASFEPTSPELGSALSERLYSEGIFCPYVDYPGDSGAGCLRFTVSADHRRDDLQVLEAVLGRALA